MLRRLAPLAAAAAVLLVPLAAHAQPPDPAARSCDWPMFGHTPQRTFASTCPQAPDTTSVRSLHPRWVFHTSDVVTAQPAVVDGTVYAGAWDGTFYALDQQTGAKRWQTVVGNNAPAPWTDAHQVDYGQVTASAAVATVAGTPTVFIGSAGSLYALDAGSGAYLWRYDVDPQQPAGRAEIESSPVVWTATPNGHPWVIFGSDANQSSDYPGEGMWAVDAVTHTAVWHFNPEAYTSHALYGCGNVWSSPALDLQPQNPDPTRRAMLFFGMADCPDNGAQACPTDGSDPHCPAGGMYDYTQRWQPYAEAVVGLDAAGGTPVWSYQPHTPLNTNDDDFGSSAQVFSLPGAHGGHRVVGEGGKDGSYYVLDRDSGALVWKAVEQGNGNLTSGQAIGGFIGNTAVGGSPGAPRVFGSSAIDTPLRQDPASGQPVLQDQPAAGATPMRSFSGADGTPAWQAVQGPSYGASTVAGGVVYNGALDGLLRAYDASTGLLLWAFPLGAPVSSGAAVAGRDVVVGAGTSENGPPVNPLSMTGEIWDLTTSAALPQAPGALSAAGGALAQPAAPGAGQTATSAQGAPAVPRASTGDPLTVREVATADATPVAARSGLPGFALLPAIAAGALLAATATVRRRRRRRSLPLEPDA